MVTFRLGSALANSWHPTPRLHGRAMGCLSRVFQRNFAVMYRERAVHGGIGFGDYTDLLWGNNINN